MNIKHLAIVRVWSCCMSGRDRAEISRVSDDRDMLDERVKGEMKMDKYMGEGASYFVMPYDAAKHMVDTINSNYEYELKVWRSKVYGEPMPTR